MDIPAPHTEITVRLPHGGPRTPSPRPLVIPIFIPHRGCPHRCRFCNQSAITGTGDTRIETVSVREEVRRVLTQSAPDRSPVEIAFFGGNFLGLSQKDVAAFLKEAATLVASGAVDGIRFSTRPDTVTERSLAWIRPFPVKTIEIGAQSMVDRVLDLAGRGHRARDTRVALGLLRKYHYVAGIQLMVGLPGESEADALATGKAVARLAPDFVRIYPTVVVQGSPLAKSYEKGDYHPLSLAAAVSRTKRLYRLFQSAEVPVIRMGLHVSTDPDLTGTVVAGPIHPAFGHLVLSEMFLDHISGELEKHSVAGARLTLVVHPSNLSRMQGQNCENLSVLERKFHLNSAHAVADAGLARDEIRIRIAE